MDSQTKEMTKKIFIVFQDNLGMIPLSLTISSKSVEESDQKKNMDGCVRANLLVVWHNLSVWVLKKCQSFVY